MERKTARLTLLIDPDKKAAFERLCASQDVTPSQVVRRMIRDYLAAHGISYAPSGAVKAALADARHDPVRAAPRRKSGSARPKGTSGGGTR